MKEVNLIKFSSNPAMVADFAEYMEYHKFNPEPLRIPFTGECLVDSYVKVEVADIKMVMYNSIEHYIAVDREVWEYLYAAENPVTAKSQEQKITTLEESERTCRAYTQSMANRFEKFKVNF